jgi:hypothetical protein
MPLYVNFGYLEKKVDDVKNVTRFEKFNRTIFHNFHVTITYNSSYIKLNLAQSC